MKIIRFNAWLVILLLSNCKKNDSFRPPFIEGSIRVNVVDANGRDLLNTPVVFDNSNISVSHVKAGKEYIYSQGNSNSKSGFLLSTVESKNILQIYASYENTENFSTTLLRLGQSPPDTLKCEFIYRYGTSYLARIWLNGQLKFSDVPRTNMVPMVLNIVK